MRDKRDGWSDYRQRMIQEMDLEVKAFTCKRGDAFIWHGGLLHGGLKVEDESATRKSFVVHYSTAAHYTFAPGHDEDEVHEGGREVWHGVGGTTDRTIESDGCLGVDNPLREMKLPRLTVEAAPAVACLTFRVRPRGSSSSLSRTPGAAVSGGLGWVGREVRQLERIPL